MAIVPATKSDLADKRWLDNRVLALKDGIDAARDIWSNWTDGRNVSRLVDTKDYGKFIAEQLGHPLTLTDAIATMPGASTRAIAAVAGVSKSTVAAAKAGVQNRTPAPVAAAPATVLGTDGKTYPAKKKETPIATAVAVTPAPRPVPPIVILDEWAKVRQAISIILAAQDDHVIAAINGFTDVRKRRACANLMRSTAIRMNRLRKEVNP